MKKASIMSMCVVAVLSMVGRAEAVDLDPPGSFSGPVIAVAGMVGGVAKVVWMEKSSSNCQQVTIGTSSGLDANYVLKGTNSSGGYYQDELIVSMATFPNSIILPCNGGSATIYTLLPNGFDFDIVGNGGEDFISGATFATASGGDGDDWIVMWDTNATVVADENSANDGRDAVLTLSAAGAETVETFGNKDCSYDETRTFSLIDCGAHDDDQRRSATSGTTSCDDPVTNCNTLH